MGASESKLAFKQSIFQLATHADIHPEDAVWAQFYKLPESADDVFSLWSPNDLRNLTGTSSTQTEPKKNLETLLYRLISRLKALQNDEIRDVEYEARNTEVVNCMRILTRLFPFIYEAQHLREWTQRFFWQPRRATYFWDHKRDRPGRLFDGMNPKKEFAIEELEKEIDRPLGQVLVECVVKYCFFPGFTIPLRFGANGQPEAQVGIKVWQTGIGCSKSIGCSKENERFQQETVRLLLTISSLAMYMTPNDIASSDIQPLTCMTTTLGRSEVNGLVCSLLNTVLKYNPNLWSALSNVNGALDLATGATDAKRILVTNCLHLILVLCVYEPPTETKNMFRQALSSLHRPDDLQFIHTGLSMVLSQPVSSAGNFTVAIGKDKAIPWSPEVIALLWELLQCNRRFRRYLVETGSALDYVVLVLYYALDAKEDVAKHGVLRMCVFVLQTLTAAATFPERLNLPFKHAETLPGLMRVPNFHGSYADYLICSIYTLFRTVQRRPTDLSESVYPAFVAILQNILPSQKNLARATSSKLMSIFDMLSNPAFLFANDSNNALLIGLLEAFGQLLERGSQDNPRFIEVLVANRGRFTALRTITIEGALAEMDRKAQERKDRGLTSEPVSRTASLDQPRSPTSGGKTASMGTVPEDEHFAIGDDEDEEEEDIGDTARPTSGSMSEKARGKQPETATSSVSGNSVSTSSLPSMATIPRDGVGGGWRPSQGWMDTWFERLPLDEILNSIDVAEEERKKGKSSSTRVAETLRTSADGVRQDSTQEAATDTKSSTMQHFQWTPVAIGWYMALIWSRIYLCEAEILQGTGGLYAGTNVRLFVVRAGGRGEVSLRSPWGGIDAVGNSIASRISSLSMKGGEAGVSNGSGG